MDKNSILTGIIGLLLGCIIGFLFANNLNQGAQQVAAVPLSAPSTVAPNQNLPPNHPQVNQTQSNEPLPEVTEAIKKAEAQPKDFDAQLNVGDLYYQIQRYDEAAKFYERASKIRPEVVDILVKTGNAYFDAENYETAEKWYTSALAKNPKDPNVRTDLGLTFYLRNPPNVNQAIKEYKTSLEINPNHELSLQNLVVALREKGDAKETKEVMDRLAKINPNNPVFNTGK